MAAGQNWTWDETMAAFALYRDLPVGKHDSGNKDVKALAAALGRTGGAVVFKLGNIKAGDPNRSSKGLTNGSKLDVRVWEEYAARGDDFIDEAFASLDSFLRHAHVHGDSIEDLMRNLPEGEDRAAEGTRRLHQHYFRNMLLESYGHRCCFTGLGMDELLIASHIKPWKDSNSQEKTAPSNGLLLNALHDRAFDKGLMTIIVAGSEYRIVVSQKVKKQGACNEWLWRFDGREIIKPSFACPETEYIEYHNDVVFQD